LPRCGNASGRKDTYGTKRTGANKRNGKGERGKYDFDGGAAGLWERKRKSRPRFGELVQFDGSRHGWFEGRGKKRCLMNMAGDAAGKTRSMLFEEETALSAGTGS
jgi:hypothetical protein